MKAEGFHPYEQAQNPWSEPVRCPLKSHKQASERSASFGYNFEDDRFNCFGCKQSGRTVEFLSALKGVSKEDVADQILDAVEHDIEGISYSNDREEIQKQLFDFSSNCQKLIQLEKNNPIKLKQIEKVLLFIDCYLLVSVPKHMLELEELKIRLHEANSILKVI